MTPDEIVCEMAKNFKQMAEDLRKFSEALEGFARTVKPARIPRVFIIDNPL